MTDVNIDEYIRELSYSLIYHPMPPHLACLLEALTFIDKDLPDLDGPAFLRQARVTGSTQVVAFIFLPQACDQHTEMAIVVLGG